jgi:hypothetical protein
MRWRLGLRRQAKRDAAFGRTRPMLALVYSKSGVAATAVQDDKRILMLSSKLNPIE